MNDYQITVHTALGKYVGGVMKDVPDLEMENFQRQVEDISNMSHFTLDLDEDERVIIKGGDVVAVKFRKLTPTSVEQPSGFAYWGRS